MRTPSALRHDGPATGACRATESPRTTEPGAPGRAGPAKPPSRDRPARGSGRPHTWWRRLARVSAAIALGVLLAVLAAPRPASAHAVLVRTEPANAATVTDTPRVLRLWFSEEISPTVSSARLVDRSGRAVEGARSRAGRDDPRLLEVEPPHLANGTYGILWQVLAEDDGHTTSGTVVFSVGAPNGALAVRSAGRSAATPLDTARRWLEVSALAGLIGGLAVTGGVLGRVARRELVPGAPVVRARRRVLTLTAACAAIGVVVGLFSAVAEADRLGTPGRSELATLGELLSASRWGHLWLAREIALIALIPLVLALRAGARHRAIRLAIGGLAAAVVWIEALGSHASTVTSGRDAAIVSAAVHILAACVWLGALPPLVIMLWPTPGRAALLRSSRGPFTQLVAVSVGLVLVTGLYNAGTQVAAPGDLVATSYGRTLLVKSALLLLLLAIGSTNARRWRTNPIPSRRFVVVEAVIATALLLAVAVLVDTAPARGPAQYDASPAQTRSASIDDLSLTVSVTPNRPGTNAFTVLVASSRRPPPAPIRGVTLDIGGRVAPLAPAEVGRYFGTGRLDSGDATVRVIVRRGGVRSAATVSWHVGPPAGVPEGARQRLAPYVNGLAVGLLVALALLGAAWGLLRRRSRDLAPPSDDAPVQTARSLV
jgi:copper transport protein